LIPRNEELSLNAWPAFETLLLNGWVVRFAGGYTRRSNSVVPLYPGPAVENGAVDRIAACEALYRQRGLPTVFKLTGASQPAGLDDLLAARGYQAEAHTSVQLLDLKTWQPPDRAQSDIRPVPDEAWLAAFARMSAIKGQNRILHERILASIIPSRAFACLSSGGQIAACGLGVLQDGHLGLFDIVVDPDLRRRGYGEQVVRDLLAWGKHNGAHTTYLQVMLNNPPALALYARVGYQAAYSYWYRGKGLDA
jgi:ribosomal protein S18 acetylase RimI-like enzyme